MTITVVSMHLGQPTTIVTATVSVGREEKFKLVEGKCSGKSLVWLVTPWSVAIRPKRKRLQWKHTAAIPGSSTMVIGGRALLFVETIQRWIAATADHNGPHTAVFFQILEICNKHNQHMGSAASFRFLQNTWHLDILSKGCCLCGFDIKGCFDYIEESNRGSCRWE